MTASSTGQSSIKADEADKDLRDAVKKLVSGNGHVAEESNS